MALLGSGTLANMGTAFYLRENVPIVGPVIAPSFEAIGTLTPLTPGKFVAHIPPGANALRIETPLPASLARWGIGVDDVEAGANSGSDFTINRYDDTGALLQVPLSIQRSTGILTTMGGANIGDGTAAGGAVLNIAGQAGPSRVYDAVYNPPPAGLAPQLAPIVSLVSPFFYGLQPAGSNLTNIGTFTVPKTGVYLFTSTFTCNVASDAAGLDSSCIIGASDAVGMDIAGVPGVNFFQNMKPWSMPSTTAVLPGIDYIIKSTMSAVLSVGQTYTVYAATENISGTMKFPDNGGPGFGNSSFNFDLVALC